MNFPSYIILNSYTITKEHITFNVSLSDYEFYLKWTGNVVNCNNKHYVKAEKIFLAYKKNEKWEGFILNGVFPSSISTIERDGLYEVSLMYDWYNNVSDEYINKMLKYEIRKDKIKDLL